MKYPQSKQLLEIIKKSRNILLTLHPSPDGDSVASNLALYLALRNLKKKVTLISGDSELPQNYETFPSATKIVNKNISEIDLNDFDLFIVLDITGYKRISRLDFHLNQKLTIVNIDHHATNKGFGHLEIIDKTASSTSQIIFEILSDLSASWRIKIDKNIAICLMAGIYDDCLFKYKGVDSRTFEIASILANINPEFSKLIFDIENRNSPDRLKVLSIALSQIENPIPHLALTTINYDQIQKLRLPRSATENTDIANTLKSVIGNDISACLVEFQPNLIKISLRTRDQKKYNLIKLAKALGGGGHAGAGGCNLKMSLDASKTILIETTKKVYNL